MALALPADKAGKPGKNGEDLPADEAGYELIDLFGGQEDLEKKIIKAVGEPDSRFNEDALRILRAVRIASELDFTIESETKKSIKKHSAHLKEIAQERIRDELVKTIMSDRAKEGIELMSETGILKYIMPEMEEGIGIEQNKYHSFTVWEHNLKSLEYAVLKKCTIGNKIGGSTARCAQTRHQKMGRGKERLDILRTTMSSAPKWRLKCLPD